MIRDRRSAAQEQNLHRSYKPCRAEQHLNDLLNEKRKLKKKNLVLREERDKLESDIQKAIQHTRDVLHMKKNLLLSLETARLDKNTPSLRLLQRERCLQLEEEIQQVGLTVQQMTLRLQNIEMEYQANIKRYDEIVLKVGEVSQQLTHAEACVVSEINNLKALKAVNFDNEKMRRLLEEQKNMATKTQLHEHKSYEGRQKQYQTIKAKLNGEQAKNNSEAARSRQKSASMLLYSFLKSKVQSYYRKLLTFRIYTIEGDKSIKCLENLARIGQQAGRFNLRNFFAGWYRKALRPGKLVQLTERALASRTSLKCRIKTMSTWNEEFNRGQLSILNDYEKGRMLNSLRLQLSRKQLHLAFNKWRSTNKQSTGKEKTLSRMAQIWQRYEKRVYFRYWKCEKDNFNRYIQNHTIQEEFNRLKSLGRAMRRWRFSMLRQDGQKGDALLKRNEMRELVAMRVRYLRRKAKLITILNIKGVRNDLRSAFYHYWCNVFGSKTVERRNAIEQQKSIRDDLRLQLRQKQQSYASFRKEILTRSIYKFMYKKKGLAFMDWYNVTIMLRKRAYLVYSLLKRKDTSEKLNALNRFRKNQRDFEKKEMHAVLTDLNKKMETINEKSTEYREKLQKSIEQLGLLGAKKIDALIDRNTLFNMKAFFERFRRKAVSQDYRNSIKSNVFELAHRLMMREAFGKIVGESNQNEHEAMLKKVELKFRRNIQQRTMRQSFQAWRDRLQKIKKALRILEQYETLYFFYRTTVGWRFIKQKVDIITNRLLTADCKSIQKNLETRLALLDKDSKEQARLQHGLKELFIRFIRFETLSQNNKTAKRKEKRLLATLHHWKKQAMRRTHLTNQMYLFQRLLERTSMKVFFNKASIERYRAINYDIKDQMSKLAKKRKTFQQKSAKSRMDVTRRLQSETAIYEKLKKKMERRVYKHDHYLEHLRKRNMQREVTTITGSIFAAWKREYSAVRRLFVVLDTNQYWDSLRKGMKEIKAFITLMDNSYARQLIIGKYMSKKNEDLKRLALLQFRYNIRANTISQLNFQIEEAHRAAEHNKVMCVSYAPLIADAKSMFRTYTLLKNSYLKFKKYSAKRKLKHERVAAMNEKIRERVKFDVFKLLKWRRYFKQTSRDYVQTQLNRREHELLRDTFLAIKHRHDRLKWACHRIQSSFVRNRNRNNHLGFLKIRNVGLYNRDVLAQKRNRALTHILKKKVTDQHTAQQTFLYRWHFLLISRHHYLSQILDTLSRSVLLSPFYKIREHAYWNPYYINKHAEKAMNDNKTQTKADMNLLLEENIDPEEIKDYMKNKNAKDTNIIKSVVCKLRVIGDKPLLVRAWHSWKDYLSLKANIKKALTKMFTICDGKGKYWNRWKGKDKKFADTLQRESRGNMVGKYSDLVRLLKDYRKDVKTNIARTQQLTSINEGYEDTLRNSKFIALRSMSHFVRTGMTRTLRSWREKILEIRQLQQNYKFDSLGKYIEQLMIRKQQTYRKVTELRGQNLTLRESCMQGGAYANMLKELLYEKERLSIVLADKKHNMKILLQDNLKIKQKLKTAQQQAIKLISEFEPILKDRSHQQA